MNNGEWLNKTGNLTKSEEISKGIKLSYAKQLELEFWLNAEHETTADEDAFKIGWKINVREDEIVVGQWGDKCDTYYGLLKDGTERLTMLNVSAKPQIDIPIFDIRAIADKKRKEMGWKE